MTRVVSALSIFWLPVVAACGSSPSGASSGGAGGAETGGAAGKAGSAATPDAGPTKALQVVSQSQSSYQEAYSVIARAPSGVLAVAWMGYRANGTSAMGYSFSSDDGSSWTAPGEIVTPGHDASDQAIVADDAGNFYLVWLGLPSFAPADQYYADKVYVARAAAGSTTFASPVQVSDDSLGKLYDRAWIAKTGSGALFVTFNQRADNLATTANSIAAVRSVDGSSWQHVGVAEGPGYRNQAYVCGVGTGGRLLLLHRGSSEGYLVLRWSDDDGTTWPSENLSPVLAQNQHVEFDPTCAVSGGDVWVLYSPGTVDSTLSAWMSTAIQVVHSADGGKSFGDPVNALDPAGPAYAQKATLALEPSGVLDVVYYAGQTNDDPLGTVRFVRSTDRGASFSPSTTITGDPFTVTRGDYRWFGDYMTALGFSGELFVAYVDTSSEYGHVAVARQPLDWVD